MGRYIRRRLITAVPVFFGITLLVFLMVNLAPGSITDLMGEGSAAGADKAALEAFQAAMQSQLTFAGNMRGSEEYRRHLANVLTGRCLAALQEG